MSEYQEQALDFLKRCNAKMNISFGYIGRNETWDNDKTKREVYRVTITTPRGEYSFWFYDSIYNYERKINIDKKLRLSNAIRYGITGRQAADLRKERKTLVPTEYDVLACLTKYEPGTFRDFCYYCGYDDDSIKAQKIYFAVQEEYENLRRLFTPEQMDLLSEIN